MAAAAGCSGESLSNTLTLSPKKLVPQDSMIIAVNNLIKRHECKILKVNYSNGSKPKAFTTAACDVEAYPFLYPFHTLFPNSLKKLINCYRDTDLVDISKRKEPGSEDIDKRGEMELSYGDELVIQKLLWMFEHSKEVSDKLRKKFDSKKEGGFAVQVAHHLLKPLSKFEVYKINHHTKYQSEECLCCKEPIEGGQYKDTSMGHEMVWHGSTDILMGDVVNIIVRDDEMDENCPKSTFDVKSSFEIEDDVGLQRYKEQIIAQTVVFSFLQNKENKSTANTLIPTIAISKREVVIFFYDAHYDILLESETMNLYYKDIFNPHTLLALWLAINYRVTCTGLTKGIVDTKFNSDFLKHFSKDIRLKYKRELRFGNCAMSQELEEDTFFQLSEDRSKPIQGDSFLYDDDIQFAFKKSKELILG